MQQSSSYPVNWTTSRRSRRTAASTTPVRTMAVLHRPPQQPGQRQSPTPHQSPSPPVSAMNLKLEQRLEQRLMPKSEVNSPVSSVRRRPTPRLLLGLERRLWRKRSPSQMSWSPSPASGTSSQPRPIANRQLQPFTSPAAGKRDSRANTSSLALFTTTPVGLAETVARAPSSLVTEKFG